MRAKLARSYTIQTPLYSIVPAILLAIGLCKFASARLDRARRSRQTKTNSKTLIVTFGTDLDTQAHPLECEFKPPAGSPVEPIPHMLSKTLPIFLDIYVKHAR